MQIFAIVQIFFNFADIPDPVDISAIVLSPGPTIEIYAIVQIFSIYISAKKEDNVKYEKSAKSKNSAKSIL